MLIPEDGSLPQITRKGFAAFNNVMLIKVPEKLKKPGETNFQLATLDRSKKGERWPADKYVDIIMNTSTSKETNSAENASNCTKDNVRKNVRKKFNAKRLKAFSKNFNDISEKSQGVNNSTFPIVSPKNSKSNRHFIPNEYQDHNFSHRRFDNHAQFNERTFNGDSHNYRHPNNFSNDQQPYGGHDLLREGTSSNPPPNRYGVPNQIIPREPPLPNISYNENYNFRGNPPLYPNTFATNPQENNFNRTDIPNFGEMDRTVDPNIPDAYTNNYNEVPRNLNYEREAFPYHNSNRLEPNFINNNFERPPYHHDPGLNDNFDAGNNFPPLLPFPPHLASEGFNNYNETNHSSNWKDRNQPRRRNSRFRKGGNDYKSWRGVSNNKYPKGYNRGANNRYRRKKPS